MRLSLLATLFSLPFLALAQYGGPGDSCAIAIPAVLGGQNTVDTIDYPSAPLTQNGASNASWYSYTPTVDGTLTAYSCLQGTDTRVFIYKGSCDNLQLVATNDDACEMEVGGTDLFASQVYWEAQADTLYYIVWDNLYTPSGFNWRLEPSDVEIISVTVSVDMSQQNVIGGQAFCIILDQNFLQINVPLVQNGVIWSGEASLIANTGYIYIFTNGTDSLENLTSAPCSVPIPGANISLRSVLLGEQDTVLATTCFGYCGACPPPTHTVTLVVDMQFNELMGLATSDNGVYIAGDFQTLIGASGNWLSDATPLTQIGSTTQWEGTFDLPDGTYEYKFLNGNAWGTDESVSGTCMAATNGNRLIAIIADTVLSVCFNYCSDCESAILGQDDLSFSQALSLYPNPTFAGATLTVNLAELADLNIVVFNPLGQTVLTRQAQNISKGEVMLNFDGIKSGSYYVRVTNGAYQAILPLVKY
jgi:Secretion system C-terminal sorting domain